MTTTHWRSHCASAGKGIIWNINAIHQWHIGLYHRDVRVKMNRVNGAGVDVYYITPCGRRLVTIATMHIFSVYCLQFVYSCALSALWMKYSYSVSTKILLSIFTHLSSLNLIFCTVDAVGNCISINMFTFDPACLLRTLNTFEDVIKV